MCIENSELFGIQLDHLDRELAVSPCLRLHQTNEDTMRRYESGSGQTAIVYTQRGRPGAIILPIYVQTEIFAATDTREPGLIQGQRRDSNKPGLIQGRRRDSNNNIRAEIKYIVFLLLLLILLLLLLFCQQWLQTEQFLSRGRGKLSPEHKTRQQTINERLL